MSNVESVSATPSKIDVPQSDLRLTKKSAINNDSAPFLPIPKIGNLRNTTTCVQKKVHTAEEPDKGNGSRGRCEDDLYSSVLAKILLRIT
ncbi:Hypothetical protein CINCED_3A000809 [Cinara cedri]|uniref:Uncharacterized protein n=1 Tax=Cinara cedri TaxID=506608 RepID=A0A5E4NDA8_9HEMI|nr:Hypothetical protein CINCED_3A000809 [Cinara cedri]